MTTSTPEKPDPMQHMTVAGTVGGALMMLFILLFLPTEFTATLDANALLVFTGAGAFFGLTLGSLSGMLLSIALLRGHDAPDAITRADLHNHAWSAYMSVFVPTFVLARIFIFIMGISFGAQWLLSLATGLLAVFAAYLYIQRTDNWLKLAKQKRKTQPDVDVSRLEDSVGQMSDVRDDVSISSTMNERQ
ncbi:MAG: hypothetical protein AAFV98_17970 [Chloroflexota bacterium]